MITATPEPEDNGEMEPPRPFPGFTDPDTKFGVVSINDTLIPAPTPKQFEKLQWAYALGRRPHNYGGTVSRKTKAQRRAEDKRAKQQRKVNRDANRGR